MSIWRLSPLQWHPFTAIPALQPATLLSIIKRYGSWTYELMDRCRVLALPCPDVLAFSQQ